MAGYQWAWSRFRILRIVFFALLIVGHCGVLTSGSCKPRAIYPSHRNLLGRDDSFAGPIPLEVEVSSVPEAVRREVREPVAVAAAVHVLRAEQMTAKCNPTSDARERAPLRGDVFEAAVAGFYHAGRC
jgi:hypothetical protein